MYLERKYFLLLLHQSSFYPAVFQCHQRKRIRLRPQGLDSSVDRRWEVSVAKEEQTNQSMDRTKIDEVEQRTEQLEQHAYTRCEDYGKRAGGDTPLAPSSPKRISTYVRYWLLALQASNLTPLSPLTVSTILPTTIFQRKRSVL